LQYTATHAGTLAEDIYAVSYILLQSVAVCLSKNNFEMAYTSCAYSYACVAVDVYACVAVDVYACVAVDVYACVAVDVYACVAVDVYACVAVDVYACVAVDVYACVAVDVYACVAVLQHDTSSGNCGFFPPGEIFQKMWEEIVRFLFQRTDKRQTVCGDCVG